MSHITKHLYRLVIAMLCGYLSMIFTLAILGIKTSIVTNQIIFLFYITLYFSYLTIKKTFE